MENKLSDLDISDINYDICSMLYKGDFNKCIGYGDEKLTLAISIFVYRSLYTNPFYVAVDIYISVSYTHLTLPTTPYV